MTSNKILNSGQLPVIAGPCAIENGEMFQTIVAAMTSIGIYHIRAGIFKPRTSPKAFQGFGASALPLLRALKEKYNIKIVSEIVAIEQLEAMAGIVDIFQVGSRNMYHYALLKKLGEIRQPILLKRGLSATIQEFIGASEYILQGGNPQVILCERGIRSFDSCTRNVLDLAGVALLKQKTNLPVIVDLSHSLGRKDIILPVAKAAIAVGADGLMVEVHNDPPHALSDAKQQLSIPEFYKFYQALSAGHWLKPCMSESE